MIVRGSGGGGFGGRDGDRGHLGVDGAGLVREAAVDAPAVEIRRDIAQLHGIELTVFDLQIGEHLGGFVILDIRLAVRADEMPAGELCAGMLGL